MFSSVNQWKCTFSRTLRNILRGQMSVQTLTADTSGISGAAGFAEVAYGYRWPADDPEIDGATSSTSTPQSSDGGRVIREQFTFMDDDGGDESLISEGTAAVVMGGSSTTA